MPTYLCHGFRWQRRSIRVYVVVQNLDDAAPEWIVRRGSARTLIESFYRLFDFLPEYTPPKTRAASSVRSIRDTLRSYSISQPVDNSPDSEDNLSYDTARSSRSRSRSISRSQQPFQEYPLSLPKESVNSISNTSQKRSKSETRRKKLSNASSNPPLSHQNHSYHQPPPSPPASHAHAPSSLDENDTGGGDDVLAQDWSPVKLVEEYDPKNLEEVSRPYAYVADYVRRIDMSCSIVDEIARYEERNCGLADPAMTGASSDTTLPTKRNSKRKNGGGGGWFEKLRDELQRGEDIRWYVVVNGDEERNWPDEAVGKSTAAEIERGGEARKQAASTHQQLLFEDADKDHELEREKLQREMGYEQGGIDVLTSKQLERKAPPKVPKKDLPPLRTKLSMDQGALRPKTPKIGGFRKLFGRTKSGDEIP